MSNSLYLKFYNPPPALLASGSSRGVELGGSKLILSIDENHNFYNEGTIYTEMSWGEFYNDVIGLDDQIDTFTTQQYESIRDDPKALITAIVKSLEKIMAERKLFYGIGDFEVDAFMNQNTVIPGLKLESGLINKLMDAHKEIRDRERFPKLMKEEAATKFIHITLQGTNKQNIKMSGSSLEDIADRLRFAKGFATGLIVSSNKSANFFIMNDRIVFQEDEVPEFYIDKNGIMIIETGIERERLFPISWFRFDIGIRSLETLELWDEIKNNSLLSDAIEKYNVYVEKLIIDKYMSLAVSEGLEADFEKEFYSLNPAQRKKVLTDMAGAIRELTNKLEE
ncbi:MAG: hypothetical protein BAJALOKI1v1_2090006 [Promethearchaeota archaeon]|nr:MAG: hypothetical protein BAJALOKI1v1_2090006 [Candidatus Lokiarchaeota archaeon]